MKDRDLDQVKTLEKNSKIISVSIFIVMLCSGILFNYDFFHVERNYSELSSMLLVFLIASAGWVCLYLMNHTIDNLTDRATMASEVTTTYWVSFVLCSISLIGFISYELYTSNISMKRTKNEKIVSDSRETKELRGSKLNAINRLAELQNQQSKAEVAQGVLFARGIVSAMNNVMKQKSADINQAQSNLDEISIELNKSISKQIKAYEKVKPSDFNWFEKWPALPFVAFSIMLSIGSRLIKARIKELTYEERVVDRHPNRSTIEIAEYKISINDFPVESRDAVKFFIDNGSPSNIKQVDIARHCDCSEGQVSKLIKAEKEIQEIETEVITPSEIS